MIIFKDFSLLEKYFRIDAPYMSASNDRINLGEISIQGSRHAEILKLYLSLYLVGKSNYNILIQNNLKLTQLVIELIQQNKNLELFTTPELNIILFRAINKKLSAEGLNNLNFHLQQSLLNLHGVYLGLVNMKNNRWLKMVLLNPYITEQLIQNLFSNISILVKRYEDLQ